MIEMIAVIRPHRTSRIVRLYCNIRDVYGIDGVSSPERDAPISFGFAAMEIWIAVQEFLSEEPWV